jgi:hypothetical protein
MKLKTFKTPFIACLLLLALGAFKSLQSQTLNDSNLPIVLITTDGGAGIPDEPKIGAKMTVIFRGSGQRNYLSDTTNQIFINYKGRIAIERRGSSSQWNTNFGKYSYSMETQTQTGENNNVSLIGLPKENDWVLYSGIFDKTLIRNMLSYELSNRIGRYAPRCQPCEVILNGGYAGIYILTEKIKQDKNRVDIMEMTSTDNGGQNVTGGYIYKIDKSSGSNNTNWTSVTGFSRYQYDTPDETAITSQQKAFIKSEVDKLETAMSGSNPDSWADPVTGYPNIIDVRSFTDQQMLHELAGNLDMLASSMFYYKERNGKIVSGPIWDHDLGYGNHSTYDAWRTDVFFTNRGQSLADGPFYYQKLMFDDMNYRCQMNKRWHELRAPDKPLATNNIMAYIDSLALVLKEADTREQERYMTLGKDYFNAPSGWETRLTYQSEIDYMKSWINVHLKWLDDKLVYSGDCNLDVPPNLVINEIMYHASGDIGVSNSDEKYDYIELKNAGMETIQLQGIFFSSGITYKFPEGVLSPDGILVLAADAASFKKRYGFSPFAQYTGVLSNKGDKLIIETPMGSAIDSVFYSDTIPWPAAEPTYNSIELKDVTLNNNRAENWFIKQTGKGSPGLENNFIFTGESETNTLTVKCKVYPNPLGNTNLTVELPGKGIFEITLHTITGQIIFNETSTQNKLIISREILKSGIYILNVRSGNDVKNMKVIVR